MADSQDKYTMRVAAEIEPLDIKVIYVYDEYWEQHIIDYKGHFQPHFKEQRIRGLYFDLESAIISCLVYRRTRSNQKSETLTDAIRLMLGIDKDYILDCVNEESKDSEKIKDIINGFNLDPEERKERKEQEFKRI